MKKKSIICMLAFFLSVLLFLPVQAQSKLPRVTDQADVLSVEEENRLRDKLDEISKRQKVDVVAATVDSLNGTRAQKYADQFYHENDYGHGENKDGILLLISEEDREWSISTTGFCITAFTDAGLEHISDRFIPMLREGNYYDGFLEYADLCDEFLTQAHKGKPYDKHNLHKKTVSLFWIPGSLLIGFLGTLLIALVRKSALKSVKLKTSAKEYTDAGSMHVTESADRFINRTVVTRKIVKNEHSSGGSSTHIDSSGTKRGGTSGTF